MKADPDMLHRQKITDILNRGQLNADDLQQVLPIIYQQLKHMARKVKSDHRHQATLNTTALVHDMYLKVSRNQALSVESSRHFYRIAAKAMRQILIDAARARLASKRQRDDLVWGETVQLQGVAQDAAGASQLLEIHRALETLHDLDVRLAQIVELHFFAGYTFKRIAQLLHTSESTVMRDWRKARAWLYAQLQPD